MPKPDTFAIFLLCAAAVASQGPTQPSNTASPAVSTLLVSARAKGGPVELAAADLEIKENGKPVRIQQVRKLDLPIRYCVLFDTSGSEHSQFKRQQGAAIQLLEQVIRPKTDLGWFSFFSADSKQGNETDNPNDIINAIAASRAYGPTALYDATAQCAARMERGPGDMRLRVMFLFSDGEDNQSHITRDRAIETAVSAGLRIYAIGGSDSYERRRGSSVLKKLADSTGGEFSPAGPGKDIDKVAAGINEDLRNVFSISYETEGRPGDHQKTDVKCLRRGIDLRGAKLVYLPQS